MKKIADFAIVEIEAMHSSTSERPAAEVDTLTGIAEERIDQYFTRSHRMG